jgi:hypothetical protein
VVPDGTDAEPENTRPGSQQSHGGGGEYGTVYVPKAYFVSHDMIVIFIVLHTGTCFLRSLSLCLSLASPSCADRYAWTPRFSGWFQASAVAAHLHVLHASWWWWWWHYPRRAESASVGFTCLILF